MTAINSPPISSPPPAAQVPATLRTFVGGFIARKRRFDLVRAIGWAGALSIFWLGVECVADRFYQLDQAVRAAWLTSNIMCVAALIWEPLVQLFSRRYDWLAAAGQIEGLSPRFNERLLTLTSQSLARQSHRGSSQLLDALLRELDREIDDHHPEKLIPPARMLGPWNLAIFIATIFAALYLAPWLAMPRLVDRALRPWLDLPPVTTTTLVIDPGNIRIARGQPLDILLQTHHLAAVAPLLNISEDGRTWRREMMNMQPNEKFTYTIAAIDRDLQYFITAGDATSPRYSVQVLHPPIVSQIRVQFEYPPYTNLPARSITVTDGQIAAPSGSRASLEIFSTEPLAGGTLVAGSLSTQLAATGQPAVRACTIDINKDQDCRLNLLSTTGVSSVTDIHIHAVADQPPAVRFIQPEADLRQRPGDRLVISGQATDDYGVTAMNALVRVNNSPIQRIAMRTSGEARNRKGDLSIDLGSVELHIGDELRLRLSASDMAGHESVSDEQRTVLIAPSAVDVDANLRLLNLRQAATLAGRIADDVAASGQTLSDSRTKYGGDTRDPDAIAATRQGFNAAAKSAQDLNRALLRAVAHSDSPELSVALARWVDQNQKLSGAVDRAGDLIESPAQSTLPAQLQSVATMAKQMEQELDQAARGQTAASALANQQDLSAAPASLRPAMQQEIASSAKHLGLNPADPNLSQQLQAIATQGRELAAQQTPVDFAKSSQAWAKTVKPGHRPETDLDARLAAAAQAEAIRPDANMAKAGDLALSSRAAAGITAHPNQSGADEFPKAMAALQRENQPAATSEEAKRIQDEAAAARDKMAAWADSASNPSTPSEQEQRKLDAQLESAGEMARHHYDTANADPKSRQAMKQAQRLDALKSRQDQLNAESGRASADQARNLAQQQQAIAQSIQDSNSQQNQRSSESTANAMAAMDAAMNRLSQMSRQLDQARQAAAENQKATARAQAAAKSRAAATQPSAQAAAQQQMNQAQRDQAQASQRQSEAAKSVSPSSTAEISQWLSSISPQADPAAAAVEQQLKPALDKLSKAMQGNGDPGAVDGAASAAQSAVRDAQNRLAQAQRELTSRDPTSAAQWYAQSAAGQLSNPQPDSYSASQSQQSASMALGQAWQQSIRRAAKQQIAQSPLVSPILSLEPQPLDLPAAPTWGQLRTRDAENLNASLRDQNPPGYEESIKAYFEALNRTTQQNPGGQ